MIHKIIRLVSVRSRTGLSRSGVYAAIKAGTFPRQLKLGPAGARASGWVESEIDAWIQDQIDANRKDQDGPLTVSEAAPKLRRKPETIGGGKHDK
jgi:predicted DNA-binding transcriptional regulator AlpA